MKTAREVRLNGGKYGQTAFQTQENLQIRSPDGCEGISVPSAVVRGHDFHKPRRLTGKCRFKAILTGPAHPSYGTFRAGGRDGLGINDLKVVKVVYLLTGICDNTPLSPDFAQALAIERIIHGIAQSATAGGPVVLG